MDQTSQPMRGHTGIRAEAAVSTVTCLSDCLSVRLSVLAERGGQPVMDIQNRVVAHFVFWNVKHAVHHSLAELG